MQILTPALRFYWQDRTIRYAYLGVSGLLLVTLILSYWLMPASETAALHYNIYYGIDFIGNSLNLLWVPIVVLILSIINFFVGLMIWRHDRIISYFMAVGTLFLSMIAVVSVSLIINLAR